MNKKIIITALTLGLSVATGSVYAASNSDMWAPATSSEPINLEEMAKEKGITLDELIVQLEEEGKLTEAASVTESVEAEGTIESDISSDVSEMTESSEPVNLEEMAKEKGITLDELIAQLEEEGKLMEAVEVTESIPAESSNK